MASRNRNPVERYVAALKDEIVHAARTYPRAPMPYAAIKLSNREQMQQYVAMRDNPQEWAKLLREQGLYKTLAYMNEMEGRYADSGIRDES